MPPLTYANYLDLEKLLTLQNPRSTPAEHDEMLFIIIHQTYELWFKQLLHEFERIKRDFSAGDLFGAIHAFKRTRTIMKVLVAQIDILETMTPSSFSSFRDRLDARTSTEQGVQELMQKTLDAYGSGVQITQVQMQKVDPPAQVIDAFRDVQAARADLERLQNEAQTYANRVVPDARGRAAQILQVAEGYQQQAIAEAKGQSARFLKVYDEYKKAPDVTRQRIYLETMERILGGSEKLVYDGGSSGSQSIVPYLPLSELTPRRPPAAATTGQQQPPAGGTR